MSKVKTAAAVSVLKRDDRVRVDHVDLSSGWFLANVLHASGKQVTVQLQCKDDSAERIYPVNQVKVIDGGDRDWLLGLTVPVPSRKKRHVSGIVVDVNDTTQIEYPDGSIQRNTFKSVVDALFADAAEKCLDEMPWNNVEAYEGPSIHLGTEVYKQFKVGWFFGTIDEGPTYQIFVREGKLDSKGYFFHVTYSDGDEEWISYQDVCTLVAQAKKQRYKEVSKMNPGKENQPLKPRQCKQQRLTGRGSKRGSKPHIGGADAQTNEVLLENKRTVRQRLIESVNEQTRCSKSDGCPASQDVSELCDESDYASSEDDSDKTKQAENRDRRKPARSSCRVNPTKKLSIRQCDSGGKSRVDEISLVDAVAVQEEVTKPKASLKDEDPAWGYQEMGISMSNELHRGLHSKECSMAACAFERMLRFHKQYICRDSRIKMIDMLIHGPVGHTSCTRFPDKQRVCAAVKIFHSYLGVSGMHNTLSADLVEFGWEKCLQSLSSPLFMAVGDESRTNHDAFRRVGDSLFVKANCMEFFARLLAYEHERCLPTTESVAKRTLMAEIANTGHCGSKEALQLVLGAYFRLLSTHGYLLIGQMKDPSAFDDGPTYDCLEQAIAAAERLYHSLGQVCSRLAWLYSVVESESIQSVSHLIGSLFMSLRRSNTFDPSPFLIESYSIETYWARVMIKFITGFQCEILPQLRPLLANQLGCAHGYNQIFAFRLA